MADDNLIRAGVIGWPVSHSLSPRLHGFWLDKYQIHGSYEKLPVEPEGFPAFLEVLQRKGFKGANVTVPYKERIMEQLDEVDDLARRIGAVNTITCEAGIWRGTNTDAYGFMESLRTNSDIWRDGVALILGAGGAARAVCVGLLDEGFDVVILNRSVDKAQAVCAHLNHPHLSVSALDNAAELMKNATLLVNTTTLGMKGQPPLDIAIDTLPEQAYVADIVYSPEPTERTRKFSNPTVTDFLARATQNGHNVVDGLGMLLYQAQAGFEQWFGKKPEVTRALRSHVLEGLVADENQPAA